MLVDLMLSKEDNCHLPYPLPQAIGLPRHNMSQLDEAPFPLLSEVTEFFLQNRVEILNSRELAGGFVMGCAKKSWFEAYIKKVVEKFGV